MQPFRHGDTGSALISAGVKESFPDLAVTYCGVVDLFQLIIGQRIERGKNISDIPRLLVCARKSESTEQRGSRLLACPRLHGEPSAYTPSDFRFVQRFGGYEVLLGLQKTRGVFRAVIAYPEGWCIASYRSADFLLAPRAIRVAP